MNMTYRPIAFSAPTAQNEVKLLIDSAVETTKMAMHRYYGQNFLSIKHFSNEDYKALNDNTHKSIIKYCAERSNLIDQNFESADAMVSAFANPMFESLYFAIITEALKAVNADNEVEQIMVCANVVDVNLGDSKSFEIESKALFKVQDGAYGNNVTRYNQQYKSSITVTPKPKVAAVAFDVTQMVAYGYDFGKMMAKIAMSFRTQMYVDVINTVFTTSFSTTPFYEATFAKETYMELADRVRAANSADVSAFGTRVAFGAMSNTVTTGFATIDEMNKTGFIGNLYNVRSVLLDQAIDSSVATADFRLPNDKVLLMSSVGDKPVKLVKEGGVRVSQETGELDSLYKRVYKMFMSWDTGLATQAHYGIQVV